MFRMKRLICAKFGKDLFNISKVIGRKKSGPVFWLTVYLREQDQNDKSPILQLLPAKTHIFDFVCFWKSFFAYS